MAQDSGQAGATEIAKQIASAVQRQEGEFVRSKDLSQAEDLTAFMMFDSVNLLGVAESLLSFFDIYPVQSGCHRSPE